MNRYSPYYDHDTERVEMSLDERGSWVHINSVDAIAVKALQRENAALREALVAAHRINGKAGPWVPCPCRWCSDAALSPSAATPVSKPQPPLTPVAGPTWDEVLRAVADLTPSAAPGEDEPSNWPNYDAPGEGESR